MQNVRDGCGADMYLLRQSSRVIAVEWRFRFRNEQDRRRSAVSLGPIRKEPWIGVERAGNECQTNGLGDPIRCGSGWVIQRRR